MRLRERQIDIIKSTFITYFAEGDSIYLYGSRVDDTLKGGDIDLFIETRFNFKTAFEKRISFKSALKNQLGDQKIDVTIDILLKKEETPFLNEVKKTRVLIMKKSYRIIQYIRMVNIQVARLHIAYKKLLKSAPWSDEKISQISDMEIAFLDMLSTRFSKIQDLIGTKIFPFIIEVSLAEEGTFIDKLNQLEKLQFIDDAQWWTDLRDVRNSLTHYYPNEDDIVASTANKLLEEAPKLIAFWEELKPKVEALLR